MPPLVRAAKPGHLKVIARLLEAGASTTGYRAGLPPALMVCLHLETSIEVLQALLKGEP